MKRLYAEHDHRFFPLYESVHLFAFIWNALHNVTRKIFCFYRATSPMIMLFILLVLPIFLWDKICVNKIKVITASETAEYV